MSLGPPELLLHLCAWFFTQRQSSEKRTGTAPIQTVPISLPHDPPEHHGSENEGGHGELQFVRGLKLLGGEGLVTERSPPFAAAVHPPVTALPGRMTTQAAALPSARVTARGDC